MIPNLIKKLFASNHLNRKSSETFVIELIVGLVASACLAPTYLCQFGSKILMSSRHKERLEMNNDRATELNA